jgi:hypothetical protein
MIKKFNEYKNTKVISAFPGCGKTFLFKNNPDLIILDSDSSNFDKENFPQNYINHIISNIGKVDIILVSSHKEVREALIDSKIDFTIVYPSIELKDEYIKRYIQRGSPENFIELLKNNWENWITEIEDDLRLEKIKLSKGEYLSDVI